MYAHLRNYTPANDNNLRQVDRVIHAYRSEGILELVDGFDELAVHNDADGSNWPLNR